MLTFADIHNHSLFSVDDGAQSEDVCLRMIALAYQDGVRTLCFTPHYRGEDESVSLDEIKERFSCVCALVKEKYPDLTLLLGSEIFAYNDSLDDCKAGKCLPLADTKNVLIEFDMTVPFAQMVNRLLQFRSAGYNPILAHAERYFCLLDKPERIAELRDLRIKIQINAQSVFVRFPFRFSRFIRRLLKNRWVDVVASDGHGDTHRQPVLQKAYACVAKKTDAAYADFLFSKMPMHLLGAESSKECL